MCGIAGIIHLHGQPVEEAPLRAMMRAMKHRGPDDEGLFAEGSIGLGFVRLSILDLSPAGHQPMFSADGRYVIVFNGEIFNYIELREELKTMGLTFRTRTDTEVILAAWQVWGEAMLHRFNGMWAFVLYDRQTQTLFGARDRYGVKPFFYTQENDRILFGSDIRSITAVLGRRPTPNHEAIFNFLAFNRTDYDDGTFLQEVKKLPHGHCFRLCLALGAPFEERQLRPKRWYNLRRELKEPFSSPEAYRALFASAVGLRLRSDVPVGVCLSGGLDSSSIVSVLLEDYQKRDLNTFSAVYGSGQHGDESTFIRLFEGKVAHMHFTRPDAESLLADLDDLTKAQYEPVPSSSTYAQYRVMKLAAGRVVVLLDGQGADEALGGYHYFFGFYFKYLARCLKIGSLASEIAHYLANHRSLYGLKTWVFFSLPPSWRTRARVLQRGYLHPDFYHAYAAHGANIISDELYGSCSLQEALINHFEYKLEHLLKWEDRNSMWFSLEARVPFLDYRLVERTLSLPDERILHRGMTKYILREAMRGSLPEPIRMRRDKIGFETPEAEWFRTPAFQQYITELLQSERYARRGVIDVSKAHHLYQKHLTRRGNYSREIWKWIHLDKWYCQFIETP
ncbi:MAG: asparagine synthase (glutamine-hydrolyzing) [Saprospiraceae bacterium]|nr:asparagine synthase (glutamine-hydrolyzing) [Saprospiraceae bacterium]MDW8484799.1 asparagine synthase (glutamine-hydrolyzing) [Saprospiraceae bacterium]